MSSASSSSQTSPDESTHETQAVASSVSSTELSEPHYPPTSVLPTDHRQGLSLRGGGICALVLVACATFTVVVLALALLKAYHETRDFVGSITRIPRVVVTLLAPRQPAPVPDEGTIIGALHSIGKLETLHFTTQEAVEVCRHGCLFGPECLTYVVKGEAALGIDLSEVKVAAVAIDGEHRRVALRLPSVEQMVSYVAVSDSHVYAYDVPPGCPRHQEDLMKRAQQEGKGVIDARAAQHIEEAQEYAVKAMTRLLTLFGFEQIDVTVGAHDTQAIEGISPVQLPGTASDFTPDIDTTEMGETLLYTVPASNTLEVTGVDTSIALTTTAEVKE